MSLNHPAGGPDASVRQIAVRQHGLITRGQALEAGLTARMIEGRLRSGAWTAVHKTVYRLGGSPVTWHQRVMAACLATEGGAAPGRGRVASPHPPVRVGQLPVRPGLARGPDRSGVPELPAPLRRQAWRRDVGRVNVAAGEDWLVFQVTEEGRRNGYGEVAGRIRRAYASRSKGGSACSSSTTGANRSPSRSKRFTTSSASNESRAGSPPSTTFSTSSQVTGVDTVG